MSTPEVSFSGGSPYKGRVEQRNKHASLGIVCLIAFLDIVGFSILFPLFPAMLDHYLALEGADSQVGRLVAWLQDLSGSEEHAQQNVVALFGTVLGTLYSALQFLFAPVWGGLSDKRGRRPVLLITLVGTCVSYVLWVFAGSFALLVFARLLGGAMAGNVSTASAAVADLTPGHERARGMGLLGASIGMGFLFGPALGGGFSTWMLAAPGSWESGFALNPFSGPALIALILSLLNLVLVAARLPETLPAGHRGSSAEARPLNPFGQLSRLAFPGVLRTNVAYFLFLFAFSGMEFTLAFLAADRFLYEPRDNMWMFVFAGILIALVQGGVVRRMAPRLGEKRLTLTGLALLLPGFFAIGAAGSELMLFTGIAFMAVGSALAMPCMSSLVSRYAPSDRHGLALGTFRSLGALARALGPVAGGVLYWQLGSAAPYWAGAAFLVLPLALAVGLPPVPAAEPAPAA
jgi:MFS family permease